MQRNLILRRAGTVGLLLAAVLVFALGGAVSAAPLPQGTAAGSPLKPTSPLVCEMTWSLSPQPGAADLRAVSASGPNDAWAVGSVNGSGAALVERWDGNAWSIVATPVISGTPYAVVTLGPNDVWVAGSFYTLMPNLTAVVLHWNGSTWTSYPLTSISVVTLTDLTAVSTNDIWAIEPAADDGTYTWHWNGTNWTHYNAATTRLRPGGGVAFDLYSGSARATNDVWAVGSAICTGCQGGLISHYNGATWTETTSITPTLKGVIALAANDVWAVGGYSAASSILHWNGSAWTPVSSPNIGTLNSIGGSGPADLWAVSTGGSIVHYNGISWTSAFTGANTLVDVAADGPNDVWAVGSAILHYPSLPTFSDVPSSNTFYNYIQWMVCHNYISGYPCGGVGEPCLPPQNHAYFRPGNNVTRGQLAKIIASAAGWVEPVTTQTFEDVPPASTFYDFVERAATRGIIGGYPCGGIGEPCVAPANRPYYRPNNSTTRGQIAKIVSQARGYSETPTSQTFEDAPPSSTFYLYIERLSSRGIVGGYPCGGPGEPCVLPGNRGYFRPNNSTTRGQLAKIVTVAYGGP